MTTSNAALLGALKNTLDTKGPGYFARERGSFCEYAGAGVRLAGGGYYRLVAKAAETAVEVTDEAYASGAGFIHPETGERVCRYWRIDIPEGVAAFEGVCQVRDLDARELATVRMTAAEHEADDHGGVTLGGWELVSDAILPKPTMIAHIATGMNEGQEVVYFWAPGRIFPTGALSLDKQTVKLAELG